MEQRSAPNSGPENLRPGLPEPSRPVPRAPGEPFAPAAPRPPAPRKGASPRVVAALALFVVAIGVVAWVMQNLPTHREPKPADAPEPPPFRVPLLDIPKPLAIWDEKDRGYMAEFEVAADGRFDGGYHDFPFQNQDAIIYEIGLKKAPCQCSSVRICTLTEAQWLAYEQSRQGKDPIVLARETPKDDFEWKKLDPSDQEGMTVQPGERGLLRITWDGRQQAPEILRLKTELWVGPPGRAHERLMTEVLAQVNYVRPVRFAAERLEVGPKADRRTKLYYDEANLRLEVGSVGPQGVTMPASLVCWSPTRDLEVVSRNTDPCLEVKIVPMDRQECEAFQEVMRNQATPTRIRSAYRVTVRYHEQRDGKQMDLGAFLKPVKLDIRGNGEVLKEKEPLVRGFVTGEIKVGTDEQQNRIQLGSFKASFGTSREVSIWAKPELELKYESQEPAGLNLKVTLSKNEKDSTSSWTVWDLRLVVPGGIEPGPLPDDAVVILRVQGTERRVRIPVVGIAGRG